MIQAPARLINNAQAHANEKGLPVVVFKIGDDDDFGPFGGWAFTVEPEWERNYADTRIDTRLYPAGGLWGER